MSLEIETTFDNEYAESLYWTDDECLESKSFGKLDDSVTEGKDELFVENEFRNKYKEELNMSTNESDYSVKDLRSSESASILNVQNKKDSSMAPAKLSEKTDRAIEKKQNEIINNRKKNDFKQKQQVLAELIKELSNLDVAFLMDCTGSMGFYINETKQKIEHVVNFIKKEFETNVKIAFVGYRDHTDGDKRIECLEFTDSVPKFKEFLEDIDATGGEDAPEDVLGGLEIVGKLNWSSRIKVLFHIADAPHHGPRFHDMGRDADNYFDEEPRGLTAEDIICRIKEKKIKYFFVKINESTNKMVNVFNDIAGKELVQYIDMESPDLLIEIIVRSITVTMENSITTTLTLVNSGYGASQGINFSSRLYIFYAIFILIFCSPFT